MLPTLRYRREYISTPDGGQISLDWYKDPKENLKNGFIKKTMDRNENFHNPSSHYQQHHQQMKPIALFLPGITGCSQAEYLKSFIPIAHRAGYQPVALNYRGMGNTMLLTPRLYCGADDEDLRTALHHIRAMNPSVPIVATGISLGGVILCRYLIATGHHSLVDAAFLVSVVWNYFDALPNIERGLNYPLNRFLTRSLIGIVSQHEHLFQNLPQYDMKAIKKCRTLCEFDDAFTIRMFNFDSIQQYYTECVHKGKILNIKKPTLCINAADDMFAPGGSK